MPKHTEEHKELMSVALKRFEVIQTAEHDIRKAGIEDVMFTYNVENGQWPKGLRKERENEERPCLTSNKLRKFVAQVANRERDLRPVNRVIPVDDKGDVVLAQIYDDLIRQIEYQSKAAQIYTKAGEQAIAGGFGYWRILTEFVDDGFDQEIKIKGIDNQFSVYYDPRRRYCFIREGMTVEEFKEEYPDADVTDFENNGPGEKDALWYEDEKVFVAEYFYKKPVDKTIVQTLDPKTGETEVWALKEGLTVENIESKGFKVLKTRTVKSHEVRWVKMTGSEILEERTLPGKHIPVVEAVGDEVNIEGKTYKRSLIRDGKDPQRMYNYHLTKMTETVALAPNAPYIATAEQIEGHETMWENANIKNQAVLLYNADGQTLVPKREPPPQVPTGGAFLLNVADKDIQDTIGMFEASFGQQGNERSKVAIDARSQKSDLGTFHFQDNLHRAILHTARILIDIIPQVYDTERTIRIRGEGMEGQSLQVDPETGEELAPEEEFVTINETIVNDDGEEVVVHDLSVGKYDIRENIRSSATRRQEATEFMTQALQYAPDIAPMILDLIFSTQDWPGAKEIAARIKQNLPALAQGGQPPATEGTPQTPPAGPLAGL
ncbi:MAG: hypothetical protein KAR40_09660 [Candidatus Sabulitectum sp.]|nr:hypothetical protein [Candidatus Sabulitectum sp.]